MRLVVLLTSVLVWENALLAAPADSIGMTLKIRARHEGAPREVHQHDTLYSGDKLELRIKVDRSAYVYVVQFFPDGSSATIFGGEPFRAPANQEVRVPDKTTQWLMLDQAIGQETLYIVASESAIPADERASAFRRIRDAHRAVNGRAAARDAKLAKRPIVAPALDVCPDDNPSWECRGVVLTDEDDDATFEGRSRGAAGMFVFAFKHAAHP